MHIIQKEISIFKLTFVIYWLSVDFADESKYIKIDIQYLESWKYMNIIQ